MKARPQLTCTEHKRIAAALATIFKSAWTAANVLLPKPNREAMQHLMKIMSSAYALRDCLYDAGDSYENIAKAATSDLILIVLKPMPLVFTAFRYVLTDTHTSVS